MNQLIVGLILLLKFLLPLLYFIYPFPVSWINWLLDTTDGDILQHFGLDAVSYQIWDKTADWFTYVMMFLVGRKWKIGKTIIVLFLIRTIGQLIYFVTGADEVFFLFPNFLEPLFMIYSLMLFTDKKKAFKRYKKYLIPIWLFIITYKMWNEWNTHIAKNDLSTQWFGVNN